jgi:predicted enzyme related to lactoylglutathione lyase
MLSAAVPYDACRTSAQGFVNAISRRRQGAISMQVNQCLINVNSNDPTRLHAFYRDVIGLPANPDMGETALMMGSTPFLVDGHSDINGATKEPPRVLINMMVDDLAAEQKRLEGAGVKFIRTAGKEYWGGVISTFVDPDGNYGQLIEFKPA